MKLEAIGTDMVAKYDQVEVDKKVVTTEKVSAEKEVKINETNEKSDKNIEEAVKKINKHLEATNTRIKFKIHESEYSLNNKVSIKVIDEESEKVIAEIPSEEAIEFSERMDQIIGFLFDASK